MRDYIASLNGIELHYRISGTGETIFLVSPGWGVGSTYLQRAFSFLAERFQVVFIDTRGSGLSGRPDDSTQMGSAVMADDLEALRLHLELPQISLLGHSNGGAISLIYAAQNPKRVKKLILVGTEVRGFNSASDTQAILNLRSTDPRFAEAVRVATAFFAGEVNPATSDEDLELFVQRILPLYLHNPGKSLPNAQKELSGPISSYAFKAQFAADQVTETEPIGTFSRIKAEAVIMVGRHDFICPVAVSERLHGTIPGSQLVIFEGSGHFPWLEEQEDFRKQLDRFLSGSAEDWTEVTNCSDSAGTGGSKNPVSSTNPIGRL